MSKYTTQSEAKRDIAAQQTHMDMHPGHGIITMMTHGDIAKRAYDIYLKTGRKQGQCQQNWFKAEHELRAANRLP
jgi:hypothetical protein